MAADVWSVTSYGELRKEALSSERAARLSPDADPWLDIVAARVESECAGLGQSLLFPRAFAERISDAAVVVANQSLKGFDGPREILTLGEA